MDNIRNRKIQTAYIVTLDMFPEELQSHIYSVLCPDYWHLTVNSYAKLLLVKTNEQLESWIKFLGRGNTKEACKVIEFCKTKWAIDPFQETILIQRTSR
jgi:hypothetical protein